MKIVKEGGEEIDLGVVEVSPTIGINDYSRRETDDFGVTTIVKRNFTRTMSVRFALPFTEIDAVQSALVDVRATPVRWEADDRFEWLNFEGFYKDFQLDLAVPPLSYCTLTVEGLAESETVADIGEDPAPSGSVSTLLLVQPVIMTDFTLIETNVLENDYPAWALGTTYGAGARVIKTVTHRVYESVAAGNIGNDPAGLTGHWIDVGPTNRWAMFDQALGTVTSRAGSIVVTVDAGPATALALLDVVGATARVQTTGYDVTLPVTDGTITFLDLPGIDANIIVTVAGTGTVSVGTLLVGNIVTLGVTAESPSAGITDFSRKEVDDFGDATVVERSWAKRMSARSLIDTDALDLVANRIAAVRAVPALWIGDDGTDALTVFGFFKDFSIEVGKTVSTLSLSIEGLSEAAAIGVAQIGWPNVIDTDPTGQPRPANGATVGAPAGTPVGDRPAEVVNEQLDDAAQDIIDLFTTYGSTASAAASASSALASAVQAAIDAANADAAAANAAADEALAEAHRNAAGVSATTASGAATTATGQAALSTASASAAATSASVTATYLGQARSTVAASLPSDFTQDGAFWTNVYNSDPALSDLPAFWTFPTVTGTGKVAQMVANGSTQYDIGTRGRTLAVAGERYTFKTRLRCLVNATSGAPTATLFAIFTSATHVYVNNNLAQYSALDTGDGWQNLEVSVTGDAVIAAGGTYVHGMDRIDTPNGTGTFQIQYIKTDNTTQSNAAANSASASSSSAAAASASASTATTQASLSASYATDSKKIAASLLPSTFDQDGTYWSGGYNTFTGVPYLYPGITPNATYSFSSVFTSLGRVLYVTNNTGSLIDIAAQGVIPRLPNRKYRVSAYVALNSGATTTVELYLAGLNQAYNYLNGYVAGSSIVTGGGFVAISYEADTNHANISSAAFLRPFLRLVGGVGQQYAILYIKVEDITESVAAASSASIATAQAATATAAAASAQASMVLTASLGYNSHNLNPVFADWGGGSGTLPAHWADWSGGTSNTRVVGDLGGYAYQQSVAASASAGMYQQPAGMQGKKGAGWYVLEAEVTLVSGTLDGAGMYIVQSGVLAADFSFYAVAGSGTAGYKYKLSKLVQFHTSVTSWDFYLMTGWGVANFGVTVTAKTLKWHRCSIRDATPAEIRDQTVLGPMEATVSTHSSAIATLNGAVATHETLVAASGSFPAIMRLKAGVGGSNIALAAEALYLLNYINGVLVPALTVEGGNAVLAGGLQVGAFIRLGSGTGWPVALKTQDFSVSDGTVVSFGTDLGALPSVDFSQTGLAALAAGETYQLYTDGLSATGFTARLKISVPGTVTNYDLTVDTVPGSGPTRQIDKASNPDSTSGNYTFQWDGSWSIHNIPDGEPGIWYPGEGTVNVDLWVKKAGVWQKVTTVSFTVYGDGVGSNHGEAYSGTRTVNCGTGVEAFGISPGTPAYSGNVYANALTDFTHAKWATTSVSGTRTATPSGQVGTASVRPS